MCTLIALHRCDPDAPLVIAANRDEYRDRPAEGLALRRAGERAVVAPLDRRAGGTWLGLNDAGLFAALTNRPTASRDDRRRSRGLLVLDALGCASAIGALRELERLPAGAYNPFNLFLADERDAFVVAYEDKPALTELAPGVHVVGNADADDRRVPKVARLLARAEAAAQGPPEQRIDALAELCRSHEGEGDPLDPACIHAGGYGTRCSTLLRVARDPAHGLLRHADGPPCQTSYEDHGSLLRELHAARESQPKATSARRMR